MGRSGGFVVDRLASADTASRGFFTFLVVAVLFLIPVAAVQSPTPTPELGERVNRVNSSLALPLAGVAIVAIGKPLEGVGLGPMTMAGLVGASPLPPGLPGPEALFGPKMPIPYPGDIASYMSPSSLLLRFLI